VCDLRRITNLSVAFNFFSGISQDCYRLAGRSMFAQANDLHVKELNTMYLSYCCRLHILHLNVMII
jgi:hypothetical protein